jgi:tetratricopeptide (TPR) repeat protein
MGATLHFFDQLLARGRRLQSLGLIPQAIHLFKRLTGCRTLPLAMAEEIQKRLGELRLRHRQYAKARRHFAAALAHQPSHAGYHHLLATATTQDDEADPGRALDHFRQAVELEPANPHYWTDLGLQALENGEQEEGVRALRKANELAPHDADILAKVVEGLRWAGATEDARQLLLAARFRNPRQPRFQSMWHDLQFQTLHDRQQAQRQTPPAADGPVLLPFPDSSKRKLRKDAASEVRRPHTSRSSRRASKPRE